MALQNRKSKAQIEKEISEVKAIQDQLQEEKRQSEGLPSTKDSAQGAILREAQKIANQIVRERDALSQKTTTGKIYSRLDPGNDVISNRKEIVTAGLWSNNSGELKTMHTASSQTSSNAGKYYWDVYHSGSNKVGSATQFAIAYGHRHGSGSKLNNSDYPTKAVYTQYRNILLNPGDTQFTFDNNANEDHIYAINIQRSRLKEKLDPGNWELVLSGSVKATDGSTNVGAIGNNITKLIDNSGGSNATIQDGKRVYNVVSGTIADGEYTADDDGLKGGYGLVYPDLGIIILNPGRLKTRGVVPAGNVTTEMSKSNFNNHYNRTLFRAISGSSAPSPTFGGTYGFQARNEEEVTSTFYYIRVKNADYNFSNNPTFVTGSLGALKHASMIKDPKSYITTVGMYNNKQELLATAKLSKPLLKSFDREALIKVKLDF